MTKNALFASCCLLLVVVGNEIFSVAATEMQLMYVEQEIHLNLLKDYSVVLPELPSDVSAKIKSEFPISISHEYLGRTARIDKPEFTVLCLEPVGNRAYRAQGNSKDVKRVPPDELLCKLSPPRKIPGSFPP